ncbi:short-chain dehydrogenase/reductase SDR family protein [Rhodotorula toruloides]|uniref:Short-chain dehydrogenase/reductase SDR family protein n=1 Tax=Rhodotorula toruloides TaxID=5286 RepID=A0A511KP47_RHOTO|nr:short-chain dehydrogenase/reductase SDR family protein [Rhodotorula toruloides]
MVAEFGKERLCLLKLDIEDAVQVKRDLTPELVQANLNVNLYGVMHLVSASLPLLRKGQAKQIFAVSSTVGSLGGVFSENSLYTAYCMSKTILNMYMRKLSVELKEEGFTVVMYSPGFVKFNLTGGYGNMEVDQAVKLGVENVIRKVTKEDNGKFLDVDGTETPW